MARDLVRPGRRQRYRRDDRTLTRDDPDAAAEAGITALALTGTFDHVAYVTGVPNADYTMPTAGPATGHGWKYGPQWHPGVPLEQAAGAEAVDDLAALEFFATVRPPDGS